MKIKLPSINLQKIIRPMVSLFLLGAFAYTGYLAQRIQSVAPDADHLEEEQQKFQQQKLRFDRQTLSEITSPPRIVGSGRDPFSP